MKKLFLNFISKIKIHSPIALVLGVVSIATFWYIEKTKQIPQYGIVFYKMGLNCEGECGQEAKLRYFQRAVSYNSKLNDTYYNNMLSDAHYRSALIYENLGNHAKALESYTKAIEFNQKNVLAHYGIGLHYFREEAYKYALRYFRRTVIGHNNYPDDTIYYIAKIYDKQKKYNLAISWYTDFVEDNPEYAPEVYPRIAEIYYFLNDTYAVFYKLHILRQSHRNDLADQFEQSLKAAGVSWGPVKQ